MSLNEEVDLLRRIPMFAKVEPAKLKLLAFASERLTFEPGEELFHQGDAADAAYLIIDGLAEVIVETAAGPITVATPGRHALVGEIGILCDIPRTATIRAVKPLTTLRITKDLFYRMISDFPTMAVEVMRELAYRLEHTNVMLGEARARARA